jgi:hypothetical protein
MTTSIKQPQFVFLSKNYYFYYIVFLGRCQSHINLNLPEPFMADLQLSWWNMDCVVNELLKVDSEA